MYKIDIKKDNLNREILRLAAPAIINNITVPLLGLCDTAIAGHLGEASFLGAISVGTMMLNVFYWLAGFLRMGTTGLTAHSLGASDMNGCREVIRKSLIMAAVISAAVIFLQTPLLKLFLSVISPEEKTGELAAVYFRICVWSVPAQLTIMAVSGWFIGLQTTMVPMTIAIGTNVVNILFSLLFAFGLDKGFVGIAAGTLTANWIGAMAAVIWGIHRYRKIKVVSGSYHESIRWKELFSVNGALFVRSACIMGVTLTVTSVGARLGATILAANAVIMQFFLFFSYFMDGFAFSGEALAGKFSGSGNMFMVRSTMRHLCQWGVGMALIFFLIYFGLSDRIASLLTDNGSVIAEIKNYRVWILLMPPVTVAAFIFDGVFVGLTNTKSMMWVTLAGAGAFFILLQTYPFPPPNDILWLGFETYLFIRGGALAVIFVNKFGRKERK